jgi:transposase
MPAAEWLLADRGYDADWYREALKDKGIRVCIPGSKSRKKKIRFDRRRYRRRNRIEIMFGRLKDWPIVRKTVPWTVFLTLLMHRNPIRPLSKRLPLRHRPRGHRALLPVKVNESGP